MSKAHSIAACHALEDMPNIGPSLAGDLRLIGVRTPSELSGRDPYALYDALCRETRERQDPCVLDTFIAAVRFAEGGPPLSWWRFTAERKQALLLRAAAKDLGRGAPVSEPRLPPHPGPLPTGEREKSGPERSRSGSTSATANAKSGA